MSVIVSMEASTLSLRVPGPSLPQSLKGTEQSFRLQLLVLHVAPFVVVLVVVLQRPGGRRSALRAALLGGFDPVRRRLVTFCLFDSGQAGVGEPS